MAFLYKFLKDMLLEGRNWYNRLTYVKMGFM